MDKNKETALEKIRELGLIHLEKKTAVSPVLTKLLNRRAHLEMAAGVLSAFTQKKKKKTNIEPAKYGGDLANHVVALSDRRKKLLDYIVNHLREKSNFEKWGEFEPADFAYLSDNGVKAYLYDVSLVSYEKNAGAVPVIVLSSEKKNNLQVAGSHVAVC
jgi:V/A-type H+-transporting ATPase subunit I